ncbi:unnamed protein product, partial [Meganyctiphanes norvegica]
VGLVTSCVSLSKNFAGFASTLDSSSSASTPLVFVTAFIAAGGRVLVCCLMAVVEWYDPVSGGKLRQTWWMLLPVGAAVVAQITVALWQFGFNRITKFFTQKCLG